MDDDGDETPERRKEMLALRQAGYGDRVAVSLGNVPTGPVKDYSFRGRNALRKPAGNVANSIKKPRLLVDGSRKLPRTPESPYRPRTPDESTGALHLTRWCSMAQRFHASTREES